MKDKLVWALCVYKNVYLALSAMMCERTFYQLYVLCMKD